MQTLQTMQTMQTLHNMHNMQNMQSIEICKLIACLNEPKDEPRHVEEDENHHKSHHGLRQPELLRPRAACPEELVRHRDLSVDLNKMLPVIRTTANENCVIWLKLS